MHVWCYCSISVIVCALCSALRESPCCCGILYQSTLLFFVCLCFTVDCRAERDFPRLQSQNALVCYKQLFVLSYCTCNKNREPEGSAAIRGAAKHDLVTCCFSIKSTLCPAILSLSRSPDWVWYSSTVAVRRHPNDILTRALNDFHSSTGGSTPCKTPTT